MHNAVPTSAVLHLLGTTNLTNINGFIALFYKIDSVQFLLSGVGQGQTSTGSKPIEYPQARARIKKLYCKLVFMKRISTANKTKGVLIY